jgi:hypothetical protein
LELANELWEQRQTWSESFKEALERAASELATTEDFLTDSVPKD